MPIKTPEGKVVLFYADAKGATQQREFWPVDARILIDNGTHSYDPPEDYDPVLPFVPPRHAGVPVARPASQFVAPEGSVKPAAKPKTGNKGELANA
jgi:hypothetical protein